MAFSLQGNRPIYKGGYEKDDDFPNFCEVLPRTTFWSLNMAPHGFRVVFLDLMPRLYTLRALIISSLFIVSININWTLWLSVKPLRQGLWVFLYALIATHHTIRYWICFMTPRTRLTFSAIHSAFNWPILYGGLELPLIILELVGLWLLQRFSIQLACLLCCM